jgi:hypothetical protein
MVACISMQTVHAQVQGNLRWRAWEAYENEDFARCADLYSEVIAQNVSVSNQTLYNAACCFALSEGKDEAFDLLHAAAGAGFNDVERLQSDDDLVALRRDSRWNLIVDRVLEIRTAYLKAINIDMYNIYIQDQADRSSHVGKAGVPDLDSTDWEEVGRRDQIRREQTRNILEANGLRAPDDFYHAAMIFQHGGDAKSYALARDLARKAIKLDPSLSKAYWLSAAAQDRYLWAMGEPQWYGTQIQQDSTGAWTLEPIDPSAVTDEERGVHGVPPIKEVMRQIDSINNKNK